MELRHLRYFIAVAEEGSLTEAAEKRLHTSQPSLSRQIRDLEYRVGAALLIRSPRGVELTPAGRAFLDHARLALAQVDAAREAARRATEADKPRFAIGFLTGQEIDWLPAVMGVLREELSKIEVNVSSGYSPDLADALTRGKVDVAFMRREKVSGLEFRVVGREPLVVVMPSDHRLASRKAIALKEIARESYIGISRTAPELRTVIEQYLQRSKVAMKASHEADNLAMAMSLVASTRGVALLPAYATNFLPWSVASRPLQGDPPTIDLVVGYAKANGSEMLRLFLSRIDRLVEDVAAATRSPRSRPGVR